MEKLKVFLVEDEIVMREGIKNNIDWEREGFIFAGEASDGELAYPMIRSTRPDILITDIKMPFMDGLELSRLVKREFPHIKILILSGHNEFTYAKEAIKIGVTDYLLKPISQAQLLHSVKEIAGVIYKEKEQQKHLELYKQEMQEREYIEQQQFFDKLLKGSLGMSEILERGSQLGINLTANYYNVILFKIILKNQDNHIYSEEQLHISEKIEKMLAAHERILTLDRGVEGWAFFVMADGEEELRNREDKLLKMLLDIIKDSAELEYFGGVGTRIQRLREIPLAFERANRACSFRYLLNSNQIIYADKIDGIRFEPGENADIDIRTLDLGKIDRRLLDNFLRKGLKSEAALFIEDYFFSLGSDNVGSLLFRQYIAMDMYFGTLAFIEELGHPPESIVEECGDIKTVATMLGTPESTKEYLVRIIEQAVTLRDNASTQKYRDVLEDARRYIEEHYDKDEISLNTVSASVNMSPNHFSTVFKQETGQTFIEFLTQVRMGKAKELLKCTNMKSSEIAYAVGYKDPHYFSYLFKKIQECTPKEFRLRGREL